VPSRNKRQQNDDAVRISIDSTASPVNVNKPKRGRAKAARVYTSPHRQPPSTVSEKPRSAPKSLAQAASATAPIAVPSTTKSIAIAATDNNGGNANNDMMQQMFGYFMTQVGALIDEKLSRIPPVAAAHPIATSGAPTPIVAALSEVAAANAPTGATSGTGGSILNFTFNLK
jgi:hypothetical protein